MAPFSASGCCLPSHCPLPSLSEGCEELQMALSKHTAAGTQGKGDRSSWGSRGRDGRWGEQEMSSCNLGPLFFCLATISAGSRGCLFAKKSNHTSSNASSCETAEFASRDDLGQTHHGTGPDVVRGNKGAGVVWCQGIPQSKAGLGVNGFKKFPIVL